MFATRKDTPMGIILMLNIFMRCLLIDLREIIKMHIIYLDCEHMYKRIYFHSIMQEGVFGMRHL